MVVPRTSLGIRSGVNCMREKGVSIDFEINFAISVFATPGTPSMSTWPLASMAAMSCSTIADCPTMTFPISDFICSTASLSRVRSVLLLNNS